MANFGFRLGQQNISMFLWFKNLFRKNPPIKKEIGGFEILDGVVIGPSYFSKNGQQCSALICPPIWAFNYSISNALNRLNKPTLPPEEFQGIFNSLLDDLIADILIYFENRLKIIIINDKLKHKMNSIHGCVKAYRKLANIELKTLCDISFLKNLDRIRGDKHHTHRRYDSHYTINDVDYDTIEKLRELVVKARKEIQDLDRKLAVTHKDYEVKIERLPSAIKVEWTAVKHALDMTNSGRIVPQQPTIGLDPKQIKYFSIQVNYKK